MRPLGASRCRYAQPHVVRVCVDQARAFRRPTWWSKPATLLCFGRAVEQRPVDSDLASLSYELGAGLLTVLPVPIADTRRVIGIRRRTDSLASRGAKILMEDARRWPALLASIDRNNERTSSRTVDRRTRRSSAANIASGTTEARGAGTSASSASIASRSETDAGRPSAALATNPAIASSGRD